MNPGHPRARWSGVTLVGVLVAWASLALATRAAAPADPFLESSAYDALAAARPDAPRGQGVSLAQYTPPAQAPVAVAPPGDEYADVVVAGAYDAYGAPRYGGAHVWQSLPDGLIYRSYMAGPREPRISTKLMSVSGSMERGQNLWDATVGGRRGLLRYGTTDPLRPQGWQLDIEGAALVRLNIDEERDVEASDFRFGVPLTYGASAVQFKTGYYHLSSHLGDEFSVRNPDVDRINYIRDSIMLGLSYNPTPDVRIYGETAYAVFTSGGAEPWEFQFGVEVARPGPTGACGTPFFATNAHLREELDFGGDWTTQLGWLWRGESGSTFRTGLHYMNGKSTQYQFFRESEEQIGFGMWYDY